MFLVVLVRSVITLIMLRYTIISLTLTALSSCRVQPWCFCRITNSCINVASILNKPSLKSFTKKKELIKLDPQNTGSVAWRLAQKQSLLFLPMWNYSLFLSNICMLNILLKECVKYYHFLLHGTTGELPSLLPVHKMVKRHINISCKPRLLDFDDMVSHHRHRDRRAHKHTHNTHSFTAHVVHKYDHNNGFLRTFLLCIHQYTWFKYKNDEDSQKERSIFFFQDKNNHDTVNADIFSFCHFIYCELNNMALSSEESYLSLKTKKGNESFETNLLNN